MSRDELSMKVIPNVGFDRSYESLSAWRKTYNNSDRTIEALDERATGAWDKWCALCEQDGHLGFDCPQEQC